MARPDYKLCAKKKDAKSKYAPQIGAGWVDEWGNIRIKLNPCVQLDDRDDIYINLYKIKDEQIDEEPPTPSNWYSDVPF